MAIVKVIFQQLFSDDLHFKKVIKLLESNGAEEIRISTAFVNAAGVNAIKQSLKSNSKITTVFVGIRNGSTTLQGLIELFNVGVKIYAVDTATRRFIFHPKFYAVRKAKEALMIIGSANMTHAGLHNNIEASAYLKLDLANTLDLSFLKKTFGSLNLLVSKFPENCTPINSLKQLLQMKREGLLIDERDERMIYVLPERTSRKISITIKPAIKLPYTASKSRTKLWSKRKGTLQKQSSQHLGSKRDLVYGPLLWEKPNLPEGDLQLLKVGHTTGVLRLTQAGFNIDGQRIDQTKYFRNRVFGLLDWKKDSDDPGKEIAYCQSTLVIGEVIMGSYKLKLSHKPAWEAGQGNYTTALHWGEAIEHIRQKGLIDRSLKLYGPSSADAPYVIEID